jgi:acetoin utilization deacetylase AcuC-like enzyme
MKLFASPGSTSLICCPAASTIPTMIGFSTSPRFTEHQTGPHHPERPDRIRAVFQAVREAGLIDSANPLEPAVVSLGLKPLDQRVLPLEPMPADEQWLSMVHTPQHVSRMRHLCQMGGGVVDLGDTVVGPQSYDVAMLAVGSALRCCDAVMRNEVRRAFSAGRPPGHHAEPDRAMGFCLFSNIAIAARYAQKMHGLDRVAIVDFDVHHGNGTQAAFEDDPSVLFISLHQHPRTCYPGTGHEWEIGTGPGRGYTVNIPFDPGSGDADYLNVLESRVVPELDDFRPQLLLISAGFDAHREDPLAHIELSDEAFELMTRLLVGVADQHCEGRVVSLLEGGYNLKALGRSVVRHLVGMGAA